MFIFVFFSGPLFRSITHPLGLVAGVLFMGLIGAPNSWGFNFNNEPGKVCLDCHVEKKGLLERRFAHGPFAAELCEACHDKEQIALRASGSDLCFICHQDFGKRIKDQDHIHWPVLEGECVACHDPHGTSLQYSLRYAGASLCEVCHLEKRDQRDWLSQHPPFKEGRCDDCHDPHGSGELYLLEGESTKKCSDSCHQFTTEELAAKHSGFPVSQLSCSACHSPHASQRPSLVRENIHPPVARGLCRNCHDMGPEGVRLLFPQETFCDGCHVILLDREEQKAFQHIPFEARACLSCHDPHGSLESGMLREPQPQVCIECHSDMEEVRANPKSHRPLREQPCTICHDPHASEFGAQLRQSESDTCYQCHASKPFTESLFTHSPAADGQCGLCHDGHGTSHPFLLKRDIVGTCMRCHPQINHTNPHPTVMSATGEVEIPAVFDRYRESDGSYSCLVCHQAHGGTRAFYLRYPLDNGALCYECHPRRGGL